jgi:c-di-GMP-binding flagellar brake protein YcgR
MPRSDNALAMGALPTYLQESWPTERQLARYKLQQPMRLTMSRGKVVAGSTVDVSEGGLGARAINGLIVGQEVELEFCLPQSDQSFSVRAIVRHAGDVRCGFEFLTITPEQRTTILRYGESLSIPKRPSVIRH